VSNLRKEKNLGRIGRGAKKGKERKCRKGGRAIRKKENLHNLRGKTNKGCFDKRQTS